MQANTQRLRLRLKLCELTLAESIHAPGSSIKPIDGTRLGTRCALETNNSGGFLPP
jgi:hypothetical protein